MKLYNSLTRRKEEFVPLNSNLVNIYVCGITPYDTTHLGHAFTYIFFDVLNRYLKFRGYEVIYTQNITDINDRDNDILKRAKEQNIPWQHLANFWTDKFLTDMHRLNWIMPDNFLWASAHIPSMIKIIDDLLTNDIAYKANGGVYLDVKKVKNFGKLSGLNNKKMLQIAREFEEDLDNPDKKNPLDITLWRPTAKNHRPHIPSFESPYGPGRPGWHLECSAMAICSLGEQIDIHGGGIDLLYPHHESEIAQSEGASGKIPYAKYWLHNELVSYQGKKMSKSVGNLVLVSDLLQTYSPNAIRYVLLSHHYRAPWEFRESELKAAERKISMIKNVLEGSFTGDGKSKVDHYLKDFTAAMEDDLDTPIALKILSKSVNKKGVKTMANILGLKF